MRPNETRPNRTMTIKKPASRRPLPLSLARRLALLLALCLAWSLAVGPVLAAATVRPALTDHVPAQERALWRAQDLRVARMQAGLPRFPYRQYEAARTRPQAEGVVPVSPTPVAAPLSLLDRAGHLARPVTAADVMSWKAQLAAQTPMDIQTPAGRERAARLRLWLGEWALAAGKDPEAADVQLRRAERLTTRRDALYGAASFDRALCVYYRDAYADAVLSFRALLSPTASPLGYDRRACALWLRDASACAGYHAQHAKMGIPEPPQLDPRCGAAALASACRALGRPYDLHTILAACRVTGEGSSLQDVLDGAHTLGLRAYAVTADDAGLVALPKPLVAHVERDHFISVIRADKAGVAYLCSDCGPWPGGEVDLTWAQWHTMNAGNYAAVCLPGGAWDRAIAATLAAAAPAPASRNMGDMTDVPVLGLPVRVASLRLAGLGLTPGGDAAQVRVLMGGMHGHVFPGFRADAIVCGSTPQDPQPPSWPITCPLTNGYSVDVATGEEMHDPDPDLTVYNPVGPSVTWQREYESLRGDGQGYTQGDQTYQCNDFGPGWTQTYNVCVSDPSGGLTGATNTKSVVMNDGSKVAFTAAAVPTSAAPVVHCAPVKQGTNLLLDWDYDGSAYGHYTVTFQDRTRWVTGAFVSGVGCYPLAQIVDRNGHAITFHYGGVATGTASLPPPALPAVRPPAPAARLADWVTGGVRAALRLADWHTADWHGEGAGLAPWRLAQQGSPPVNNPAPQPPPVPPTPPFAWPLLSSITNENGTALLTVTRATDGSGNVVLVTDCDGREVFYHDGTYANAQVPKPWARSMQLLDHVSEVVPAGTSTTPASRYVYAYTVLSNGNPSATNPGQYEQVPFLTSCSVPSPTGSGVSTTTWDYSPANDFVTSESDGNGNGIAYAYAANATQVTYTDSHGNTVYVKTVSYDNTMNPTGTTNGAGQAPGTSTYADPNDPYRPSSTTDANGHTTSYTWDQFGNMTGETSARGTVTTDTYAYTSFALGELTKTQTGSKTATTYAYCEPSGLPQTETTPRPGTAGTGATVTTSYTYDGYGNPLTVVTPGNNAASTITTTYNYTTDGSYSQPTAIGEPLTVTDNIGHMTHLRYLETVPFSAQPVNRRNIVSVTDTLGNETDRTYDIFSSILTATAPATGQSGSGRATTTDAYLYPGGPMLSVLTTDEGGNQIRQVSYTYDQQAHPISASGSTEPVTYTYDALYRLSSLTDGGGHTTTYTYNAQGYLASVSFPTAGGATSGPDTISYPSYDALGDLLSRVDGDGTVTTYTYADPENLLTRVHYSPGAGVSALADTSYTYDAYGRQQTLADTTGIRTDAYDDNDAPTSAATTYAGLPTETISYAYYPDGSRSAMTTPAGGFSYAYDAAGRPTGLTNPVGEATSWAYLSNNWLSSQTMADGAATAYTYGAAGQPTDEKTARAGTTLADFATSTSGGYDGAGDLLSVTAAGASPGTTTYAYDQRSEVTQEQSTRGAGYTNVNHYDGATSGTTTGPGNPTTLRSSGPSAFNADNQIAASGFSYDGDGSPIGYKGVSLAFDPESRMTAYGSAQTDGYTGDGLRAWKQNASGRTYYLYDGEQAVCELNSSGTVTATNTFGTDGLVSRHTSSGSVFYDFDLSGNVAQRLTSSGSVASADLTDGFGARQTTDTTGDPFGFSGQWGGYTDAQTGLVLMTHREYDPATGRFLTRDPTGYNGGINLYGYCDNDPLNMADPSGLAPRTGPDGGEIDNHSSQPVVVVFDTVTNGQRIEWMLTVPPGWKTDPNKCDIDFVPGPIPFKWRHIPGYHHGIGTCRVYNTPFNGPPINFGPGVPTPADGTGWPQGYGNDPKQYMTFFQALMMGCLVKM